MGASVADRAGAGTSVVQGLMMLHVAQLLIVHTWESRSAAIYVTGG